MLSFNAPGQAKEDEEEEEDDEKEAINFQQSEASKNWLEEFELLKKAMQKKKDTPKVITEMSPPFLSFRIINHRFVSFRKAPSRPNDVKTLLMKRLVILFYCYGEVLRVFN